MNPTLEKLDISGYEEVYKVSESESGLLAIIAIHNTGAGPAVGGVRLRNYSSFEQALEDVLRLSEGMTFKTAAAGLDLGGGKSVIIYDPTKEVPPTILRAFGKAVEMLQGRYYTAEDMNITPERLAIIAEETKFVLGLKRKGSSGNPSPFTAWGTFKGVQAALKHLAGSDSLKGVKCAIQGTGSVGEKLVEYLFWHGAELFIADQNIERAEEISQTYGATLLSTDEIYEVKCDIFSPCAAGGSINSDRIEKFKCKAVVGCANNQLQTPHDASLLLEKGILYAPDYITNSGGLINVHAEMKPGGYDPIFVRNEIDKIYERLLDIFHRAEKEETSPETIANNDAREKLKRDEYQKV